MADTDIPGAGEVNHCPMSRWRLPHLGREMTFTTSPCQLLPLQHLLAWVEASWCMMGSWRTPVPLGCIPHGQLLTGSAFAVKGEED